MFLFGPETWGKIFSPTYLKNLTKTLIKVVSHLCRELNGMDDNTSESYKFTCQKIILESMSLEKEQSYLQCYLKMIT